jgi:sulfite exporter TauE/SafE
METVIVILYAALVYAVLPCGLIWGWVRWSRAERRWSFTSVLSFAGFGLATASALLAIGALLYGKSIGGWPYYDPRLMRIYAWGALLSLSGIILGIGGVWRRNPLRWHAVACALGTLIFWFGAAGTE